MTHRRLVKILNETMKHNYPLWTAEIIAHDKKLRATLADAKEQRAKAFTRGYRQGRYLY